MTVDAIFRPPQKVSNFAGLKEEEEKMKSYISTKEELSRMSVKEIHILFNQLSIVAYSENSDNLDKDIAKVCMEKIRRELISRRP